MWCFAKKLCARHDVWAGTLSWWSCQSPVAHSCGLLNHPNSYHGGPFKLYAKVDADSLLCSLSHFECNGDTVHMLTQRCLLHPLTSTVKLSLFTHEHSSPFSLAARLHRCMQTILIILTVAGIFLDRTHRPVLTITFIPQNCISPFVKYSPCARWHCGWYNDDVLGDVKTQRSGTSSRWGAAWGRHDLWVGATKLGFEGRVVKSVCGTSGGELAGSWGLCTCVKLW